MAYFATESTSGGRGGQKTSRNNAGRRRHDDDKERAAKKASSMARGAKVTHGGCVKLPSCLKGLPYHPVSTFKLLLLLLLLNCFLTPLFFFYSSEHFNSLLKVLDELARRLQSILRKSHLVLVCHD